MGELGFLKKYIPDFALEINENIWSYVAEICFTAKFGKLHM